MLAQIIAVVIFLAMFVFIVMDKIERQIVTLVCGLLMMVLVFGLCMHSLGINWETIIFIAGMMIMVEGMAAAGFFRWLCMELAKLVHYRTIPIFIAFMIMSSLLAMFIDSITVILFLAAVTIELSRLLHFDPIPMILTEVFCANLGGSATMCGDPPNIIIGASLGYSFFDFLDNTGLLAGISLIFVLIFFYFAFRGELKDAHATPEEIAAMPAPKEAITNKTSFIISTIIFLCAIVLLVSHAETGLTVSTIGVFIALLTLITSGKNAINLLKKVDYKTLLFFVGLFIVVGGLEQTGILKLIAEFIGKVSGGNVMLMIAIILWVSAIASGSGYRHWRQRHPHWRLCQRGRYFCRRQGWPSHLLGSLLQEDRTCYRSGAGHLHHRSVRPLSVIRTTKALPVR